VVRGPAVALADGAEKPVIVWARDELNAAVKRAKK
jgi:hypothetical protein